MTGVIIDAKHFLRPEEAANTIRRLTEEREEWIAAYRTAFENGRAIARIVTPDMVARAKKGFLECDSKGLDTAITAALNAAINTEG